MPVCRAAQLSACTRDQNCAQRSITPRSDYSAVASDLDVPIISSFSLQFIQMRQPCQHHLLTRLLNLTRQEHLVQNCVHLVEIKHKIQLTHVPEERIQNLDEEMNRLQIRQLVVVGVDTRAEE
jgi:hypothetical protein